MPAQLVQLGPALTPNFGNLEQQPHLLKKRRTSTAQVALESPADETGNSRLDLNVTEDGPGQQRTETTPWSPGDDTRKKRRMMWPAVEPHFKFRHFGHKWSGRCFPNWVCPRNRTDPDRELHPEIRQSILRTLLQVVVSLATSGSRWETMWSASAHEAHYAAG